MWTPLTLSDLTDRETAALVDILRTAALGDGQDDPVPELLSSVTARLRGVLAARNAWLDPDPLTLPASLKDLAARLVLRLAKDRLNLPLSRDERADAETDDRTLRDLAHGKIRTENPSSTTTAAAAVVVTKSTRQATRELLDGLR